MMTEKQKLEIIWCNIIALTVASGNYPINILTAGMLKAAQGTQCADKRALKGIPSLIIKCMTVSSLTY